MTPLVASVMVGLGLLVFFVGRSRATQAFDPIAVALRAYNKQPETLSRVDKIELQKSFGERVVVPAIEWLRSFLDRQLPAKTRYAIEVKLVQAGRPGHLTSGDLSMIRYIGALVGMVLGLLIGVLLKGPVAIAVSASVGTLLGYYAPLIWLDQQIANRKKAISKAMPDAMDLLVVSVEAGLSLDAAIDKVATKTVGHLANEFALALTEVRLGRGRLEALDDLGKRSGVEELNNFCQAIISSEAMGTPIGQLLRLQSEEMRRRRRQKAQELGAQASLKMTIPMIGCIFPTIWVILVGPAALLIMNRH